MSSRTYAVEAMTPEEINAVIYEQVMHGTRVTCTGPITIYIAVQGSKPSTAVWSCEVCSARGEVTLSKSTYVPRHKKVAPDYINQRDLALEVVQEICARWSKEHRFLFDIYLFGIDRKEDTLEKTPLIDLYRYHLRPERICYAVIQVLNRIGEAAKKP